MKRNTISLVRFEIIKELKKYFFEVIEEDEKFYFWFYKDGCNFKDLVGEFEIDIFDDTFVTMKKYIDVNIKEWILSYEKKEKILKNASKQMN